MTRYVFAGHFVAGKRVIDLGCGTGYGSYYLGKAGAKLVVGIDNSRKAIDYCKAHFKAPNVSFHVGDVMKLPVKGVFDVAVAFELIEHVSEHERFLIEAKRHLAKRGLLIFSTPNKNTYTTENKFHFKEFYPEEFAALLKKHFRNVAMLHQAYPSAVAIVEGTARRAYGWDEIMEIPVDYSRPNRKLKKTSLYLIALCSDSKLPTGKSELFLFGEDTLLLKNYFKWIGWIPKLVKERDKAISDLSLLQSDLKEKVAWARKLDSDLKNRDKTILELQANLEEKVAWARKLDSELNEMRSRIAKLQAEFDERTQWALRLDQEVRELRSKFS
jgi:SAM-dependent methyltransferase